MKLRELFKKRRQQRLILKGRIREYARNLSLVEADRARLQATLDRVIKVTCVKNYEFDAWQVTVRIDRSVIKLSSQEAIIRIIATDIYHKLAK